MKKFDAFFVTIVSLVVVLSGVYFYAYKKLNYFENNPKLQAKVERIKSLNSLQKKLKQLEQSSHTEKRQIASISRGPEESEFLNEPSLTKEITARDYYLQAKSKCYELNKEIECMKVIDSAVTHFPESKWTGESLVILSEFYYRTRRTSQMHDILKILKEDFKNEKSIQEKVDIIERQLL